MNKGPERRHFNSATLKSARRSYICQLCNTRNLVTAFHPGVSIYWLIPSAYWWRTYWLRVYRRVYVSWVGCFALAERTFDVMVLLTTYFFVAAFIGSARNQSRWPGCNNANDPVHRENPIENHRNWHAWYKQRPDVKVHVYRDPPFNWLHPVSCNTSKIVKTPLKSFYLNILQTLSLTCRTAPVWTISILPCILALSILTTVSK